MARITPPPGAAGLFILRLPFVTSPTLSYRVGAIRFIDEMISQGDDPFQIVYVPRGLTDADYQADIKAGAAIISLLTDSQKPIYVPDTYIESFPNMGIVPHSHMIATVSLGILPDNYDLTRATTAIQEALIADVGIEASVKFVSMPTVDVVTQAAAAAAALARQGAITNKNTTYAEKLELQQQNADLRQSNDTLIELAEQLQARIDELEGSPP